MNIEETLAPTSDQLDAVDLLGGPRIFTVERVSKGSIEQPVQVHLREFPRVWRPGKSMRRVLASCWGVESAEWAGRRVELYCDEKVAFGGKAVGGTRISRLSHIEKAKKVPLLISRGQSAMWTVEPLPEPTPTERIASLRAEWTNADPERRKVIEAEVAKLNGDGDDYRPGGSAASRQAEGQVVDVELPDPTVEPGFGTGAES